jgi:hypothetical protein
MTLAQINECFSVAFMVGSVMLMCAFCIYIRGNPEPPLSEKRLSWLIFGIAALTFLIMLLVQNGVFPVLWSLMYILLRATAGAVFTAVRDAQKRDWRSVLSQTSLALAMTGTGAYVLHFQTEQMAFVSLEIVLAIVYMLWTSIDITRHLSARR